jgi:hypothetical protein
MKNICTAATIILFSIFLPFIAHSQKEQLWNIQSRSSVDEQSLQEIPSDSFEIITWDVNTLKEFLKNTPDEYSLDAQRMFKRLNIPDRDGNSKWFRVLRTELLSAETAALFPFIQSYILISEDQNSNKGRMLVSHMGVHISYMDEGFMTYIQPFRTQGEPKLHFLYQSNEITEPIDFQCLTEHGDEETETEHQHGNSRYGDCQLRTYRFAVAATGEYTTWAGGQANALASIAATVNNMNVVFERDVEIRLTLVSNLSIIFADAGTDPYDVSSLNTALLNTNTNTLNSNIGSGNYDVGHLFHAGWNGGLAFRPAACQSQKGGGASGATNPSGFVFETTVNHEVGHMLDAVHTHSANNGGCGGGNLTLIGAYEPGGGSTLMAYAGVCSPNSYQNDSDNYFHTTSMSRMSTYTTSGLGNTCGTVSGGNNAPIVTVPLSSYSIPNGTPFFLSASGSDPNGNTLTYTWEQIDLAPAGISTPPDPTATSGPNFRSRPPSTNPLRYFPVFDNVVNGVDNPYEVLPTVARTMNFRVTVRDNAAIYGCTDEADVAVNTTASGPFQVTAPSGPVTLTANGSNTFEVTWDVAGSASAPVNCLNVDILFSDDAGTTFSSVLLSNTPNDGSQTILVPNIETTSGRILVRCSNGIFYNVNEGLITINSGCLAVGGTISPATQITAEEGSPELSNLGMAPVYGQVITPIAGSVTSSDILSSVVVYSSVSMGCLNFNGNSVRLDTIPFYVSVTGSYTINRSSVFGLVTNIYQTSFNAGTVCENFVASSATHNGMSASLSADVTAILTAGVKYIMVISSFSASTPTLPAAYSVSVTSAPPGGSLISGPLNPGAGFSYTFIVRDALLGNIVLIGSNPDLSTLPAGNYIITGLSYSNSSSLPSLPINYSAFIFDYVVNGLSGFCGKVSLNERTVIIQSPLSVNFLSFEAHKEGARGLLRWEVSEEKDLDYYLLERSPDALTFSELGIVEANNSGKSGESFYQLYDEKPFTGKNYYRLSGMNLDGTMSSAGIAQLTFAGDLSLRIFPNPVSENQLTFIYDSESESDKMMSIYNMQGLLMSQAKMNGMNVRAVPQHISISKLPPGVYIFEIIEGESTIRKRFVKSK